MTGLAVITDSTTESDVMIWCEQGLSALDAAVTVVDAKGLLDIASTLDHAIRLRDMNSDAVVAASTLKLKAERRVGELLAADTAAGRLAKRGRPRGLNLVGDEVIAPPTLAEHGITYDEAAAFAKLAAVPADKFDAVLEEVIDDAAGRRVGVTRAAVLRALNPEAEKRPDQRAEDFERFIDACERALERATAAYNVVLFKHHTTEANPWPEATVNHALRVTGQLTESIRKISKEIAR